MEKIIAYKLVKPEYKTAVEGLFESLILLSDSCEYITHEFDIAHLKKTGVLDLWFEPVYYEPFEAGTWVFWNSNNPSFGKVVKYDSVLECHVLDVFGNLDTYNSCHRKHIIKASDEEIRLLNMENNLIFGKLEVEITQNYVVIDKITISKKEFKTAYKSVLDNHILDYKIRIPKDTIITIGCLSGSVEQLEKIYNFLN